MSFSFSVSVTELRARRLLKKKMTGLLLFSFHELAIVASAALDKEDCKTKGCRCFKENTIAMCVELNLTGLPAFNPIVSQNITLLNLVGNRIWCIQRQYMTTFHHLKVLDLRGQRIPVNCTCVFNLIKLSFMKNIKQLFAQEQHESATICTPRNFIKAWGPIHKSS